MRRIIRLLCPDEYVESVAAIDIAGLKTRQIEGVLVDLDNTLVPWHSRDVPDEVADWLRRVNESGLKVCIVSNTRFRKRLRYLAEELGLPFVGKVLKPRRGGFRAALRTLGIEPERAAVVGDQIFTDILGGKRLGLHTILVRPIACREFVGTKITRLFERLFLRILESRGMLPVVGTESRASREQSSEDGSQKNTEQ